MFVETEMKTDVLNVMTDLTGGPPMEGFMFDPNYLEVMDPEMNVANVVPTCPTSTMTPMGRQNF